MAKKSRTIKTNLRKEFEKALDAYNKDVKRTIDLKLELGGPVFPEKERGGFKRLNFDDVFEYGITRVENGVWKRYKGAEAVRRQIKSLERFSNKNNLKEQFITNYGTALFKVGFKVSEVNEIKKILKRRNSDDIAIALEVGTLPEIVFIYSQTTTKTDIIKKIKRAFNTSL